MTVNVRQSSIGELEAYPLMPELLSEYAEESSIAGLPVYKPDADMYRMLESKGSLYTLGAFLGAELVGYATVLSTILPHYSALVSVMESFFVKKEHRKTGAGLRLLRAAEEHAQTRGSPGLLISAPMGGVLAEVLPHVGYRETNKVFFKGFAHE